ncbi:Pre-mRNA-splicing factor 38B [Hypsibius exemplaris]|uniref:Pre-mRNA-splicing factor 38 n=1 Tax=Hypsibius exemplaris TaxID=2072580 RepID=A0A9X6NFG3_HYPEX|nr:Pre-mRNA-splicing factor 38B [Hypsibius exemplaris]
MLEDGSVDEGELDLEGMQLGVSGAPGQKKKGNTLPVWGNEKTMNINNMILTNIQQSPYYKVKLAEFKTYHEVVDQIYYNVNHLEPWERGSRKTSGQIGMCGGVRGVGAGGIVSSAFCLLYKLFTIKLTRNQLNGLLNHEDSPYLRGIGFLYIRFCQPPTDLWELLEPYLDDPEMVDPKAGGGDNQPMGQLVHHLLSRLDWYGTLFPRVPVPVQKVLDAKLKERRIQQQNDRFPQAARRQEESVRAEPSKRDSPQVAGEKETRRRTRSRSPVRRRDREDRPRVVDSPDRSVKRDDRGARRGTDRSNDSRRDDRRRSPDRRDRRRPSPAVRLPSPRRDRDERNGDRGSSSGYRDRPRSDHQNGERKREGVPAGGKAKSSDDFAELLEREKDRQRLGKKEESAGEKNNASARAEPTVKKDQRSRSSSSESGRASDSSGTIKRREKEESERKHRHKKHKSSRHHQADQAGGSGSAGSGRRESKDRSEKTPRKRSRSPDPRRVVKRDSS